MLYSRRAFLEQTAVATAILAGALPARAQMATLSNIAYLSRRLDITPEDYRTWYETRHAVDFLSFAKPHMNRYCRNYVERAHVKNVDFDVISEFAWKSTDARAEALKFMGTSEGKAVMALHPNPGMKPSPNDDHSGARTYSTDERLIAGPARTYDPSATKKHAALLRRKPDTAPDVFSKAVNDYAGNLFKMSKGAASRVTVIFAVPEAGQPAPFHDAIVMAWPKVGNNLAGVMKTPQPGVVIDNILDIAEYETDFS